MLQRINTEELEKKYVVKIILQSKQAVDPFFICGFGAGVGFNTWFGNGERV